MTAYRPSRRSTLRLLGAAPLAATGVLATSGTAQAAGDNRVPAALKPGGSVDEFVAALAAEDKFAGTVLLVHRDRPVLVRSYGLADKERSIPNRLDTIYALGSITKMFTAVAVIQLVQQGTIGLHERLGTYLDGFPQQIADTVTIHQLLTHTSGLGDYLRSDAFWQQALTWTSADQVMDGTLAIIKGMPPEAAAGTSHLYSNSGYHVLGTIVAAVSGLSYHDYVRQHVFAVATMSSSGFYTRPQWESDRRIAHPYTAQGGGDRVDAIDRHLFIGSPAGNAFASADDLVRFTRAMLGHRLLDAVHTELALAPKVPIQPLPAGPGLPAQLPFETYAPLARLINGKWAVGHNGGAPGVSANLEWFPGSEWVAITLSNYDDGTTRPVDSLVRTVLTQ